MGRVLQRVLRRVEPNLYAARRCLVDQFVKVKRCLLEFVMGFRHVLEPRGQVGCRVLIQALGGEHVGLVAAVGACIARMGIMVFVVFMRDYSMMFVAS